MSGGWVELYLDEDVDPLLGKLVEARGYSYCTTPQAGMIGATDLDQLTHAAQESKTLVTHNRVDFERLAADYFVSGRSHSGIITAVRRPPPALARRLLAILGTTSREEMKDQLIYI